MLWSMVCRTGVDGERLCARPARNLAFSDVEQKWNGWGYADSQFELNKDNVVTFTGNRCVRARVHTHECSPSQLRHQRKVDAELSCVVREDAACGHHLQDTVTGTHERAAHSRLAVEHGLCAFSQRASYRTFQPQAVAIESSSWLVAGMACPRVGRVRVQVIRVMRS